MTVKAYPSRVAADATSLVIFSGDPNVSVKWTLTGSGTLTPGTEHTDAAGQAYAVYTPGIVGETVTITATHG